MRHLLFIIILSASFSTQAQFSDKPKLVVGIIVDQMRQDYLHRYRDQYSENGLRKLVNEGFEYKNAHYNYVPTNTGPGHASVYTGTTPSRHGIIANSWYDRSLDQFFYCVADTLVDAVGGTGEVGNVSSRNLQVTTITDELRIFSNHRSKVIAVGIKDRGSAFPAGHNPTGAYWFDDHTGDFITSSYYAEKLPKWVIDFNEKDIPQQYLQETWKPLLQINDYVQSTADNVAYEESLLGEREPVFPYDLSKSEYGVALVTNTPFGNTITLDFALAAIEAEELGDDDITDFLAISFSSTDRAGHAFGPRAVEIQDMYLRFDQDIERLIHQLDESVGKGEYLIFLTADHGVSDVSAFLEQHQYPGGYFMAGESLAKVQEQIANYYGEGQWMLNASNGQIFLNRSLIEEKELDLPEVQRRIGNYFLELDFISEVLLSEELKKRNVTDPFVRKYQNGFNPKKSGDILLVVKPGYQSGDGGRKGTGHGSPYNYDTQVPILFFGKGIDPGYSVRPVDITDIAPTLSMILDIPLPSASSGIPLIELFE